MCLLPTDFFCASYISHVFAVVLVKCFALSWISSGLTPQPCLVTYLPGVVLLTLYKLHTLPNSSSQEHIQKV